MKYIFTLLNRAAEQEQQSSVGVAKRDFLTATTTTRTTATRTRRSRRGRTARYASIHSPNVLPMPNADADQSRVSTAASQSQQASRWQRQRNRNRSSPDVDSRSRRSRETLSGRALLPTSPPGLENIAKFFALPFFSVFFARKVCATIFKSRRASRAVAGNGTERRRNSKRNTKLKREEEQQEEEEEKRKAASFVRVASFDTVCVHFCRVPRVPEEHGKNWLRIQAKKNQREKGTAREREREGEKH